MKRVAASVATAAVVVVAATTTGARTATEATAVIRHGCPTGQAWGAGRATDAIAAARSYYVRRSPGRTVQDTYYRRDAANTPLVQAVLLSELPRLAGSGLLRRQAMRRCPGREARNAPIWAIVFHDQITTVCCVHVTLFVGQETRTTWYVF